MKDKFPVNKNDDKAEPGSSNYSEEFISSPKKFGAFRLLIALIGSILIAEIFVMLLLSFFSSMSLRMAALLDAFLLAIVSFPALYLFMFRPFAQQISQRMLIKEKLIKANSFNTTLIKTIPFGIDIVDEQGNILYLNENLEKLLGKDSLGKSCSLVYRAGIPCEDCPLNLPIRVGETHNTEVSGIFGKRTFFISYTGMIYENKKAILRVLRDITEHKRLEEQLQQAHKMEAIGRLAGGVAHDFNNLLTIIMGYSKLLLLRMDAGDPLRDDIENIHQAGEQASALTSQLLAFSRRQMLQPVILDLNTLVKNMQNMLYRLIGEDIELVTALEPSLFKIEADAGQIGQVVMNLVLNARDAMLNGGKLTISTQNVTIDKESFERIQHIRPGKYVSLVVADTGMGMSKDITERIFEPFFSTKVQGKGTGLGLSVVYGIVKQHEGYIEVDSEFGHGSTFIVYLPAVSGMPTTNTVDIPELKNPKGKGEKILVVEDENEVRIFVTRVLRENGYTVSEAKNAKQALEIFTDEPQFDLVFCDVVLPDKSGIELVDDILALKPETRILFSSGYADHKKSQWPIINARGFEFLPKPYSIFELLRNIRHVIGS